MYCFTALNISYTYGYEILFFTMVNTKNSVSAFMYFKEPRNLSQFDVIE